MSPSYHYIPPQVFHQYSTNTPPMSHLWIATNVAPSYHSISKQISHRYRSISTNIPPISQLWIATKISPSYHFIPPDVSHQYPPISHQSPTFGLPLKYLLPTIPSHHQYPTHRSQRKHHPKLREKTFAHPIQLFHKLNHIAISIQPPHVHPRIFWTCQIKWQSNVLTLEGV